MKPYGVPRDLNLEAPPDCADIKKYGLKSSIGRLDSHSTFHSSSSKRRARRIWKKRARRISKNSLSLLE